MNPQTALGASIDHMRLPGLSRLASISNAGLSEIQPDASRGRVRYLVLVSDSYTVFLAGKASSVDLAGDSIEQVSSGVLNNYRAVVYHPPDVGEDAAGTCGAGQECRRGAMGWHQG